MGWRPTSALGAIAGRAGRGRGLGRGPGAGRPSSSTSRPASCRPSAASPSPAARYSSSASARRRCAPGGRTPWWSASARAGRPPRGGLGRVRRRRAARPIGRLVHRRVRDRASRGLAAELTDEVTGRGGLAWRPSTAPLPHRRGAPPDPRLRRQRAAASRPGRRRAERLEYLVSDLAILGLDPADDDTALRAGAGPLAGGRLRAGRHVGGTQAERRDPRSGGALRPRVLRRRPGPPLVEDVQWFDDSTLALIDGLLRVRPRRPPRGAPVAGARGPADRHHIVVEPSPRGVHRLIDALDEGSSTAGLGPASSIAAMGSRCTSRSSCAARPPLDAEPLPSDVPDVLYEPLVAGAPTPPPWGSRGGSRGGHRAGGRPRPPPTGRRPAPGHRRRRAERPHRGPVLAPTADPNGLRFRHELLPRGRLRAPAPVAPVRVHGRVADLLVGDVPSELVDWPVVTETATPERPADAAAAFGRPAIAPVGEAPSRRHGPTWVALVDQALAIDDRRRIDRRSTSACGAGFLAMSAEGAGSAEAATDFTRCLEVAMVDAQGDEMFSTLISLVGVPPVPRRARSRRPGPRHPRRARRARASLPRRTTERATG